MGVYCVIKQHAYNLNDIKRTEEEESTKMQDSWTTLIAEKAPTNMTLHKELPAGKRYAPQTRRAIPADAEVEGIQRALELLYECMASTYQERNAVELVYDITHQLGEDKNVLLLSVYEFE